MGIVYEGGPSGSHVSYARGKSGVMLIMESIAQEVAPHRIA